MVRAAFAGHGHRTKRGGALRLAGGKHGSLHFKKQLSASQDGGHDARATAGVLSRQPRSAPVLFGNVARQIAGVVAHARHLDHAFLTAAIEKKMPRRLYALDLHSAPAEPKMVGASSGHRILMLQVLSLVRLAPDFFRDTQASAPPAQ